MSNPPDRPLPPWALKFGRQRSSGRIPSSNEPPLIAQPTTTPAPASGSSRQSTGTFSPHQPETDPLDVPDDQVEIFDPSPIKSSGPRGLWSRLRGKD